MSRRALHLWSVLLWLVAVLYGALPAGATEAPYTPIGQASADPTTAPHVALLLPTGSEAFGKAAEAVRAGFLEAASKQVGPALVVKLYPVTDDPQQVIATYKQALGAGARMVVGPLTRNGVTALASSMNLLTVPTLALNVPDHVANPTNMYTLSLQIESEARQIAQLALKDGKRKAFTITEPTALGRRMRDAFVEEFQRGGGFQIADYPYATDSATLERLRQAASLSVADMVFLALDANRARIVRPQIANLPAYGTSQLNPGPAALAGLIDLTDVRFVDMPWMLQPDHPAVMIYARSPAPSIDDLERLRALGIDAFRVTQELLSGRRTLDLDGVTGRLSLDPDGQVRRTLPVAVISGGGLSIAESKP